jgi:hypothetical protein
VGNDTEPDPTIFNVADGSKAALTAPKSDFRFTLESGLNSDIAPCPKGAISGRGKTVLAVLLVEA